MSSSKDIVATFNADLQQIATNPNAGIRDPNEMSKLESKYTQKSHINIAFNKGKYPIIIGAVVILVLILSLFIWRMVSERFASSEHFSFLGHAPCGCQNRGCVYIQGRVHCF